jgi:hypothetical protein
MSEVTFSVNAARKAKMSRFNIGDTTPTAEPGGRVGIGVDKDGENFLVHQVGRSQESIILHAVATAVASGKIIPLAALVSALVETGQIGNMEKALAALRKRVGGESAPTPKRKRAPRAKPQPEEKGEGA